MTGEEIVLLLVGSFAIVGILLIADDIVRRWEDK
jgi:hypothetical protein